MFSTSVADGGPATATRSRRRQRPLSSESLAQQPKAKRQRLPLAEATFVNPEASPETFEVKPDRIKLDIKQDGFENFPSPKKELSVRSKKTKTGDRPGKGDGSVVLTTNNAFTVVKLPALPERLRNDPGSRQHGVVYSSSGYALAFTHTHAIVWPYTSTNPSPESFTFALPYPSKHASDPLPLGSLVSPSTSTEEPGLVIVMPTSGKITYWESISSAATLDFMRQQRTGVEDTLPRTFSGDQVQQVVNAESAGFILVFNSGRLAYMSVRDGHGRPAISVQSLNSGLGAVASGLFGSLRHVLKYPRSEICAVKADQSSKFGEKTVVAATSRGKIQAWKVHRGGHQDSMVDIDIRDTVVAGLHDADPSMRKLPPDSFEVLDFEFVPRAMDGQYAGKSGLQDDVVSASGNAVHLLALVSISDKTITRYSLIELILSKENPQVGMVRPLSSYKAAVSSFAVARPRLHLPGPALVAFVIFDRAVVVASIATTEPSPDSQLQGENQTVPPMFEDVIDFREDSVLEIVGSGVENASGVGQAPEEARPHRHKQKNPSAVLIVRGVGVLRLTTTDIDKFASETPPEVTAKSKLEQAVFFGVKDDNPLVFEGRRQLQFSDSEVGEAAVELSNDILASTTPHISSVLASLELNLSTRIGALDKLISHLNVHGVRLSRKTRWDLMWNAEKMSIALALWKLHEEFMAERSDKGKKTVVAEAVEYIHEDRKRNMNRDIGQVDPLRHWFAHDIQNLQLPLAWTYEVIKCIYREGLMDEVSITRLLYEAVRVNTTCLKGALDYRRLNLVLYGLEGEAMDQGILAKDYKGLSEPWTAAAYLTNNLKRLVDLSHQWLEQFYPPKGGHGIPDPALIEGIRNDIPTLTDQYLLSMLEHSRWALTTEDPATLQMGDRIAKTYAEQRIGAIIPLTRYNLWDASLEIAEKHNALAAMAEVVVSQLHALEKGGPGPGIPSEHSEREALRKAKEEQASELLERYGEAFAFPCYEILLRTGGVLPVLEFAPDKKGYATKFLRGRPELAKISWINDIEKENDVDHAAETLLNIGLTREQQVWNKKIELSLGKLALMADAAETPEPSENSMSLKGSQNDLKTETGLERVDNELEIVRIQDRLYSQLYPTINTAVDETAGLGLALEAHAPNLPDQKNLAAMRHLFENSLSRLLRHEALDPWTLIDLLTLITLAAGYREEIGDQFYLAHRVSECGLKGEERRQARQLIWRRCYIRDDWTRLNNTNFQTDRDLLAALGDTALYSTMFDCYEHNRDADGSAIYLKPTEALGVFTTSLDRRFGDLDRGSRTKMMTALKWEDNLLRKYVDKARLANWAEDCFKAAKQHIDRQVDQQTERGAAMASGDGSQPNGFAQANGFSFVNGENGHA